MLKSASALLLCLGLLFMTLKAHGAEPKPRDVSRQRPPKAKALKEIRSDLKRFWALRFKDLAAAEDVLLRAEERAVQIWLPAGHDVLGDLAFAMTYWRNRDRAMWISGGKELNAPLPMFETAMRMRSLPRKLILLRRAWFLRSRYDPGVPLSVEDLRLAYEAADGLRHAGKSAEARRVVTTVLSRPPLYESAGYFERLGIRLLEAKLLSPEDSVRKGWAMLEQIYEEARRTDLGNSLAWQMLASEELIHVATLTCDQARLEQALRRAVETEADFLLDSPFGLNEDWLRAMSAMLAEKERFFAPLLACGNHISLLNAELTLERMLIRREAWRFRPTVLHASSDRMSRDLKQRMRSMIRYRRLQSQIQLRVADDRLEEELQDVPLPRQHSPPEGTPLTTIAWYELSSATANLEHNLVTVVEKHWTTAATSLTSNPLHKLREALPSDGLFAAYLELPDDEDGSQNQILALIVDRQSEVRWRILDIGKIADSTHSLVTLVRSSRGQAAVSEEPGQADRLREIGRALIDPIDSMFKGKKRLCLLTQGSLRQLPWQALIDRRGQYLGDRLAIQHLQSASDLLPSAAPRGSGVVLLAPDYAEVASEALEVPMTSRNIPNQFQTLPWTQTEVRRIRSLLSKAGPKVRLAVGANADEAAVLKLHRPRLLHFAGHGFQLPADRISFPWEVGIPRAHPYLWPWSFLNLLGGARYRSGIALSDANKGGRLPGPDGLLTAAEVADLDLRGTDLVVLAACETGYPIDEDATGPLDLALAFRQAGARSVVASIWKVDDRATMVFMESLYKELVSGLPVVFAAQKARGAVRRAGFDQPAFWAGFEVFGADVDL